MLNNIGRLDEDDIKELNQKLNTIFEYLDNNEKEKAKNEIHQLARTQNYFVREYFGQHLLDYHNQRKILPIMRKMLKSSFYGERATALFYFFNKYANEPDKIVDIIEIIFENTPWETENILNELWRSAPNVMKERMKTWIKSDNELKRALSFHGMENIADQDPEYIMEFIAHTLGDQSMEVQKKITHILTQVAKSKPFIVYPYLRSWLIDADDSHQKTIWVSMKKLANIIAQKSKRDKTPDFVLLTQQTIKDWSNDPNEKVKKMGRKLYAIIRNTLDKSNHYHKKSDNNGRKKYHRNNNPL
jgi:3-methyladenine DNA glycosylase AlkC